MKVYPKVLVISINAWKDNSGINTLLNLFKQWDSNKLAQIYTRSDFPNTKKCTCFFQISEGQLIKSIIPGHRRSGVKLDVSNSASLNEFTENAALEKKNIAFAKKHHSWLLDFIRELLWICIPFNRKGMDDFIDEFNPDVIFVPIYPVMYMNRLQYQILKKSNKKAVAFLGDDNYTYKSGGYNPLFYIYRFFTRRYIRRIIKQCDDVFVMVPKMKREYDEIFSINSILLTKGLDYSNKKFNEKEVGTPIKIVYTGKMIYGRYKSLAAIASSLREINQEGVKAQLYIYSTDEITPKLKKLLDIPNSSFLMGSVPMNQVPQIQDNADILVFVESLDWRYKNLARLSFSTKLTDYMYAGKCILAIGDKEIAPIEYFADNQSAIIATSYEDIRMRLREIVANPDIVKEYAKRAFFCGLRNHNEIDVQNKMFEVLSKTVDYDYHG